MMLIKFMYSGVQSGLGLREILNLKKFRDPLYKRLVDEMNFSPSLLKPEEDLVIKEFNLAHWDGPISKWRIEHCLRVKEKAFGLCGKGCNKRVVEISSRLHDIGKVAGDKNHVKIGIRILKPFLGAYFPNETNDVLEVVELHERKANDKEFVNSSLEAKVVRDADKLEKVGPSGIALQVAKLAFGGRPLELLFSKSYEDDWLKKHLITEKDFVLDKARKIAKKRIEFEKRYLAKASKTYVS